MSVRFVLGIDGGGTKTAAVILDLERRERGRGQGGPCNIATCDDDTLRASISTATAEALQAADLPADTIFTAVCAGVAGYTAKGRRADFQRLLTDTIPAEAHRVEPDFVIAYWGATEGEPGVIAIAGTGAVVYGRNAAGQTARVDGRGFLLGDMGSGFHVGRSALRQTLRRVDRGGALEAIDHAILAALPAADGDDVVEWVYRDFSPARVASLAPIVAKLAEEGDRGAAGLLRMAGLHLRQSVRQALRRLQAGPELPIYLLGGLWRLGEEYRRGFMHGGLYTNQTPDQPADVREARHDAACGAALLAMQPPQ